MSLNVAERVTALIDEVGRIEAESEGTYLALGTLFPNLVAEMEKSSENGRKSLGSVSSASGNCSESELKAMALYAREASQYFKSIHDKDALFLGTINESIEKLSTLEDIIGRVRSDSEEMEIVSLNAMTVALKSGGAGKAFSVITDELKRLSTSTIALTEVITARGRELMEYFSSLRDSLGELDSVQKSFFSDLDSTLGEGFRGLETGLRGAVDFFGGLLDEAGQLREPVQRIMQGIQLQDIIRQSLNHVSISLSEARKAALEIESLAGSGEAGSDEVAEAEEVSEVEQDPRREELSFVATVAELSVSLLADVISQLDANVGVFDREIGVVSDFVEGGESRRRDFISSHSALGGEMAVDSSGFTESASRYIILKKNVIATSRRLSDLVKSLDESFKGLAGLLARFQNIVVASRIEVAKNKAIMGVGTTVQGMTELTDRIGGDVGAAMDTTKDFIKVAYSAIADYARGDSGSDRKIDDAERLQTTLAHVERDIVGLEGARSAMASAIGDFSLYTPEFIRLIAEARDELARMSALAERLKATETEISELRSSIQAELGPGVSMSAIRSQRLREMIERFTIFTHKKTAGEIGRFDVEDGVEAGEITLF